MDTSGVIQIVILFILIFLSAFFSSAETALSTISKLRVRTLIEEENKQAVVLQKVLDNYSKMISTILIGNNIVNISASALATTLAIDYFGNYAVGFATGLLTIVVLLFGEIVPKTWAMLHNERIALGYSSIVYSLMHILTPVIWITDKLSNAILVLFHIDSDRKESMMTESDLKTYVDVSHEDGVIETEEREMIYNVFDFSDALAKDIMIPRIDMTTVDIAVNRHELLQVFRESMYTRIPVYDGDNDNIVGFVNIKDFVMVDQDAPFSISDIMREAHYTYEFKKTADLMLEMRETSSNVTFVLNEYGACVGMITLEDLLEEIVGEIRDEYDEDEEEFIQEVGTRQYLVEGGMKLDDINDALNTDFDSEDYDSIGGIMIEILDRLPEVQEEIALEDGTLLKAMEIHQNRIEKVLLTLPEPTESEKEPGELLDGIYDDNREET